MFITCVNDSSNKLLFTDKCFTGVVDTGGKTVLTKYEKIYVSKFFSFIAGAVDNDDKHSFYNNLYDFITIILYNTVRNILLRDKLHSSM